MTPGKGRMGPAMMNSIKGGISDATPEVLLRAISTGFFNAHRQNTSSHPAEPAFDEPALIHACKATMVKETTQANLRREERAGHPSPQESGMASMIEGGDVPSEDEREKGRSIQLGSDSFTM
ncbi:hypothetical protein FA15DRAFT_661653 [Coprinopsis marcescibilis]|uniref:Uncharacterized protein n=1 Tax=Coprinopsis marcescibilis TaxID=230819 RepID=A0A5C3KAP7_COPMA|nr:hypothetical protein FA15DRAFT_661653 [Coprinopsis marcescibilis]